MRICISMGTGIWPTTISLYPKCGGTDCCAKAFLDLSMLWDHSIFPTLFSSTITEKLVFALVDLCSVPKMWMQYRHKHEIAWWHSGIRWPFQWSMQVSVYCFRLSHISPHSIFLVYLSIIMCDSALSSLSVDFPWEKDPTGQPWSILKGHLLWTELSWQVPHPLSVSYGRSISRSKDA